MKKIYWVLRGKKTEDGEEEEKEENKEENGKGNDECILSDEWKLEEKRKRKKLRRQSKAKIFFLSDLNWCDLKCVLSKMKLDFWSKGKMKIMGKKQD